MPNHSKIDIAFLLLVFAFFRIWHLVTKDKLRASKAKPLKYICFLLKGDLQCQELYYEWLWWWSLSGQHMLLMGFKVWKIRLVVVDKSIGLFQKQNGHSFFMEDVIKWQMREVFTKLLSQFLNTQNEYSKYSNNMTLLYSKNYLSRRCKHYFKIHPKYQFIPTNGSWLGCAIIGHSIEELLCLLFKFPWRNS